MNILDDDWVDVTVRKRNGDDVGYVLRRGELPPTKARLATWHPHE
jgi:hypothetical protein